MILLGLAELSLSRPGWHYHLSHIAAFLEGLAMFEQFRKTSSCPTCGSKLPPVTLRMGVKVPPPQLKEKIGLAIKLLESAAVERETPTRSPESFPEHEVAQELLALWTML